jgi:hypothetical protein
MFGEGDGWKGDLFLKRPVSERKRERGRTDEEKKEGERKGFSVMSGWIDFEDISERSVLSEKITVKNCADCGERYSVDHYLDGDAFRISGVGSMLAAGMSGEKSSKVRHGRITD